METSRRRNGLTTAIFFLFFFAHITSPYMEEIPIIFKEDLNMYHVKKFFDSLIGGIVGTITTIFTAISYIGLAGITVVQIPRCTMLGCDKGITKMIDEFKMNLRKIG